ncbi:MAG: M1 family metallopeptidase [Vicinamibacterales bacterium]
MRPGALILSLTALLTLTTAVAFGQTPRSPRNANYAIQVTLNPQTRMLSAREQITWRNITVNPTSELQLHLYWNAWVDGNSTWMRESRRFRQVDAQPDNLAQFTLQSIELADRTPASNLLPSATYIAPDDGNADDRTVLSVPLATPVQPGESVTLTIAWTAKVPRTFDRTGAIGDYYFIAQWFPKLGVLEDTGWNTHQFHSTTEFFSDYGVYDVSMTVPSGWVVGATGREQSLTDNGNGTTTHRYRQEDVHDFAWTASPDFVVKTARFEERGLPPVDMRLLIQPEHLGQVERHFAATRSALRRFGSWFGAYPYGHITLVDPAYQSETGGMEYPTLFTAGTQWLISREVTFSTPEEVVVHEAGHQFWYGIVGSNEFEHAWMDEGINTYATGRALAEDYPTFVLDRYYFGGFVPWTFRDVRLTRATDWNRLWDYRRGATEDALASLSYRERQDTVRFLAYDKPAVWLATLENWLGWDSVRKALSASFVEGAFAHPQPGVVLQNLQKYTDRDINRFLTQTFRQSAVFDYSIGGVSAEARGGQQESRVLVRRLGDGVFPVDVLITFENGDQITEHWNGESRWREFTYVRRSAVRSAVVDPQRTLLLDINFTNNSRTTAPRAEAAATKWTLKWLVWLQDALMTWGLFA